LLLKQLKQQEVQLKCLLPGLASHYFFDWEEDFQWKENNSTLPLCCSVGIKSYFAASISRSCFFTTQITLCYQSSELYLSCEHARFHQSVMAGGHKLPSSTANLYGGPLHWLTH
jgi:hypothetical protein